VAGHLLLLSETFYIEAFKEKQFCPGENNIPLASRSKKKADPSRFEYPCNEIAGDETILQGMQ
jgi:hypothetical protein